MDNSHTKCLFLQNFLKVAYEIPQYVRVCLKRKHGRAFHFGFWEKLNCQCVCYNQAVCFVLQESSQNIFRKWLLPTHVTAAPQPLKCSVSSATTKNVFFAGRTRRVLDPQRWQCLLVQATSVTAESLRVLSNSEPSRLLPLRRLSRKRQISSAPDSLQKGRLCQYQAYNVF